MPYSGNPLRRILRTPDPEESAPARPRWSLLLTIAAVIVVGGAAIGYIVHRVNAPGDAEVRTVRLDGAAMEPTLKRDDIARFVRRARYDRGDIVWLDDPVAGSTQRHVRRIVAVGGDTVFIAGGVLYLNGIALPEPYAKPAPNRPDTLPVTIPVGQVYLLGDNRPDSRDSREWGPVPLTRVRGGLVT